MKKFLTLSAATLCTLFTIQKTALAQSVQILTTGAIPLKNIGNAKIYYVDAVARFQAQLSNGLSKNQAEANALLTQRLNHLPKDYTKPLQNAGDGMALALRHHINRVPAILFDDQAVVYGITDVDQARKLYWQWQQRKGK